MLVPQFGKHGLIKTISRQVSMDLLSVIPCYCNIQFTRKEFLTTSQYPDHPFAKQIEKFANLLR